MSFCSKCFSVLRVFYFGYVLVALEVMKNGEQFEG